MEKSLTYILVTVPDQKIPKDIIDLVQQTPGSRIIDFYTMNMDDLSIIAKHRILPRLTLIAMNNTKVLGRFVSDLPKAAALKKLFQ